MAESIVKLIVDATQGVRSLGRFKKATDEAAKKTDLLKKAVRLQKAATEAATTKLAQFGDIAKSAFGKASKAAQKYQSALGGVKGAIVSLGVAALTKRMIGQAASFQQTQIRLKALSAEYGEFGKIQQLVKDNAKTFNLSQAEASSQFSDVYARLRPLGKTLEEVQTVYKGFNATAIASGTNAAAASGAFLQLSQALGSGRLAGDEFRSVSEQIPGILGLVADEMGVAVSELKELGSEGKITSDILINALAKGFEKNKDKIQQILAESPAAKFKEFSNATSELSNAIGTELLPVVTPAVQELTKLLKAAGDLPGPIKTAGAALIGFSAVVLALASPVSALLKGIAAFAPAAAGATSAAKLLAGAMVILKGAMLALPWVALAAGVTAIGLAVYNSTQEKKRFDELLRSGSVEELSQKSDELAGELLKAENRLVALRENGVSPVSRAFKQQKEKVEDLKEALKAIEGTYKVKIEIEQLFKGGKPGEKLPAGYSRAADGTLVYKVGDVTYEASSGSIYKPPAQKKAPSSTNKSKGRRGKDPAVEARRRAEKIAQQLKNSEEMKINLDGQFSVLTEIDEREKIRIATMFGLSAINRKYNDLTAAALSNEEKRNLGTARGLELGTARIEQGKALEAIQKAEMASQVDFLKNQFAAAAEIDAQIEAQGEKTKDVYKGIGDSIKGGVVDALTAAVDGTKSLAEVASATLKDIGNMFIKLGTNQLFNSLGSGGGFLGKLFGSAKGNIIAQDKIVPFAKGGIVGEPTIFPLVNGTGLMGEAGPEAIMPLKRGPGGRLGVEVTNTREQLERQQAVASTREQQATANTMQPLDIRYESTVINNIEYVTAEQHRKGMAQAAERGRAMTLTTLQNSPRTRSRVGI